MIVSHHSSAPALPLKVSPPSTGASATSSLCEANLPCKGYSPLQEKPLLSWAFLLSGSLIQPPNEKRSLSVSPSRSYKLKTFQLLVHQASGVFLGFTRLLPPKWAPSRLEFCTACRISPIQKNDPAGYFFTSTVYRASQLASRPLCGTAAPCYR